MYNRRDSRMEWNGVHETGHENEEDREGSGRRIARGSAASGGDGRSPRY